MPAVNVDDLLVLERVDHPVSRGGQERTVKSVTTAPRALEGDGFPVRRAFAGAHSGDLDPFVHLDQMGEVDYGPGEPKGTPWHPHRGFETVTYMIDGAFQHADSTGGGGLITNGDTQWMTAGAGILHIEQPPEELVVSGGLFHGLQLWVNLPAKHKWVPPRYQDIGGRHVGLATSADGGALYRVIAGRLGSVEGPGVTYTPITVVHASIEAGAEVRVPWPRSQNSLVYALSGRGSAGSVAHPLTGGQLAVFGVGDFLMLRADAQQDALSPKFEVLLLGGEPIGEPVAWMGPFVMNSEDELRQAFEDFRAGRMGQIPAERVS